MKKYIYICSYWIWWTDLFHHFSVYHTFVGYILLSKENWLGPIAGAETDLINRVAGIYNP